MDVISFTLYLAKIFSSEQTICSTKEFIVTLTPLVESDALVSQKKEIEVEL